MPVIPLTDLDALDLSKVVVTRDKLYSVLKQQGRFALLDGVLHHDIENELIVGFKDIKHGDWWGEDHIPGRPLFPGALMVETCAQLSTFDFFQRRPELAEAFVGFTGINATKFRATVEPACRMLFVSHVTRLRESLFHYKCQGYVDGKMVVESEVSGMVL